MNRQRWLPVLMTTGAALLWASSFSVVKAGLRYIDPSSFVLLRFAVASAILVGLVIVTGKGREFLECLKDRYALLLGVTLAASFGLQFKGQTETSAAKAAMIINSSVVLVAPLSVLFLKERMNARKAVALGVGLCGVYLVTTGRSGAIGDKASLFGDLLISGSALCYALYVVFTKLAVGRRHFREVPLIAAVFVWAMPAFVAVSFPRLGGLTVDRNAWLAVGYLAVFCSVVPFIMWTAAIRHIGALTSAVLLLAELVFGVLLAYIFLDETISAGVFAGCALICAGIGVVGSKAD